MRRDGAEAAFPGEGDQEDLKKEEPHLNVQTIDQEDHEDGIRTDEDESYFELVHIKNP